MNHPVLAGSAAVLAWTMMDPLVSDLQDTFGKGFLYHPVALWLCIIMIVHTQTSDFKAGIMVVVVYELVKAVWRTYKPIPPVLGSMRKLLHRVQNNEPLSDADVTFLNRITPKDIAVTRHHNLRNS